MRVCLITEKPSLGETVTPYLAEMHPDLDPDGFTCVFVCPYTHLNSQFRYPRGLSLRDYPYVGEPAYEPFTFDFAALLQGTYRLPRFGFEPGDDTAAPGRLPCVRLAPTALPPGHALEEALRRLRMADVVYVALDPGDASTLAFDRCMESTGIDAGRFAVLRLTSLDSTTIRREIRHPAGVREAWYADHVSAARTRRRFDYAYQVNALAVHRQAMRSLGIPADADVPSKYGLQLLYDMRASAPVRDGEWIDRMCRWEGTGRWRDLRNPAGIRPGLGGPASQIHILESLVRSGLAQRLDGGPTGISALGRAFLAGLHPGSEDIDLPFRLEAWKSDPDGRRKVDRYIRTFFGRQIRFAGRRPGHADAGAAA